MEKNWRLQPRRRGRGVVRAGASGGEVGLSGSGEPRLGFGGAGAGVGGFGVGVGGFFGVCELGDEKVLLGARWLDGWVGLGW